ncbi:hypothetical protein TpMuguga_01g00889 [Theileria parva strain Muguga]|uniref:Uncharacterized protein n=1 Tax=Theileria parva TaxID=5875 RepID=Q4N7D1_THEPA|nr:hypothetical protein TpMuguga_01g00889 [Theileria parva strain Muguga]
MCYQCGNCGEKIIQQIVRIISITSI